MSIERIKADWQGVSQKHSDEVQRELVLCLRSNRLPTGEAFKLLLELASVLKRKCCSEFARRIGRDKGNLYDWSEKQLAYELATNQHCFGFVKEKVLLFSSKSVQIFFRAQTHHNLLFINQDHASTRFLKLSRNVMKNFCPT